MQDNIGDFWATTAQYCQMSDKSIIYKYVKPKKLVNMAFFKKPHHIYNFIMCAESINSNR